ncbi:hypothetical protein ACPPVS_02420 [Cellulomonas sp. McL0617]|uniref:hypothetical protein n=1 Tax=Cellulomonas sp. McL0617 TaxID=3415675 RepID=UPI003CFBC281
MTDVIGSQDGTQTGDSLVLACPECGTVSTVHADRRLATDFCPTCDYPLFWARPSSGAGPDDGSSDDALRRAPGASGNALSATLACPACAELNVPTAVRCVRCGALMDPPPPPPPPPLPEPAPAPVVIVQTEPCDHPPTWLVVLCTSIVAVGLTLMIVWMV